MDNHHSYYEQENKLDAYSDLIYTKIMNNYDRLETNLDNETGEICQAVICLRSERLAAEADVKEQPVEKKIKSKFHVPISYVRGDLEQKRKKKKFGQHHRKQLRVESIEESIIHRTQNVSPIVFMLPTLLIFPAWASIFCIICEACIHILSHKRYKTAFRNKMRQYETKYKSPLHLISSEFCASCRSYRCKEKIKQIQRKRSLRRKLSQATTKPEAIR